MAESKYGKYFTTDLCTQGHDAPRIGFNSFAGAGMRFVYNCIATPFLIEAECHKHPYEQLLIFIGGNPLDVTDFGAEVELSLGEECEKHVITQTTIVYVPSGMYHCPLHFKKVDKPVIFINVHPGHGHAKEVLKGITGKKQDTRV